MVAGLEVVVQAPAAADLDRDLAEAVRVAQEVAEMVGSAVAMDWVVALARESVGSVGAVPAAILPRTPCPAADPAVEDPGLAVVEVAAAVAVVG